MIKQRELHVDGHSTAEGVFVTCQKGDPDMVAPFMVFDADQQTNIAGPFDTWDEADQHRRDILGGAPPRLNIKALRAALDKLED